MAIVTSIHQPNSDIFLMYDKIYVLSRGGKCVYFGSPYDLYQHLLKMDIKCEKFQVPIEVVIKIAAQGK